MARVGLTIAGSDPSGGAGIQADLKVFCAFGVYGTAVPAALTAQNTRGVESVRAVPPAFLQRQLRALLDDVHVHAAKTGMLLDSRTVLIVAGALRDFRVKNLVVDPVMVSSSGRRLLGRAAVDALVTELLPLALLVTPNAAEAEALTGVKVEDMEDAREAARRIRGLGPRAVLIKGGHVKGEPVDLLLDGKGFAEYPGRRVAGKEIHGAGCVYSAAITACLARGMGLREAVAEAKGFVSNAIKKAAPIGKGRVPLV